MSAQIYYFSNFFWQISKRRARKNLKKLHTSAFFLIRVLNFLVPTVKWYTYYQTLLWLFIKPSFHVFQNWKSEIWILNRLLFNLFQLLWLQTFHFAPFLLYLLLNTWRFMIKSNSKLSTNLENHKIKWDDVNW